MEMLVPKPQITLVNFLNCLRSLEMYYEVIHWTCKNSMFYGDHLLAERLSSEAGKNIDAIAEKIVGTGMGIDKINLPSILKAVYEKVKSLPYSQDENSKYFESALSLEQELLSYCEMYDKDPSSSVGCRNLIGDIADLAQGRIYLLRQRLSKKP